MGPGTGCDWRGYPDCFSVCYDSLGIDNIVGFGLDIIENRDPYGPMGGVAAAANRILFFYEVAVLDICTVHCFVKCFL